MESMDGCSVESMDAPCSVPRCSKPAGFDMFAGPTVRQDPFLGFIGDFSYALACQLKSVNAASGLLQSAPSSFHVRVDKAVCKAMDAVEDFKSEIVSAACWEEGSTATLLSSREKLPGDIDELANTCLDTSHMKVAAKTVPNSILRNGSTTSSFRFSAELQASDINLLQVSDTNLDRTRASLGSTECSFGKVVSMGRKSVGFASIAEEPTQPEYQRNSLESGCSDRFEVHDAWDGFASGPVLENPDASESSEEDSNEVGESGERRDFDADVVMPEVMHELSHHFKTRGQSQSPSLQPQRGSEREEDFGRTMSQQSGCSVDEDVDFDPDSDEEDESRRCISGVINPNWPARLAWDVSTMMLVLFDAMVLPFQMAYKEDAGDEFDVFWLWMTTCFFATDIVMNFFTAFAAGKKDTDFEPGRMITSKSRIARHYSRTWLPIDVVSTVPWGTLSSLLTGDSNSRSGQLGKLTKVVKFVRFMRLMRMLRLAKLVVIWERIEAKCGSIALLQGVGLLRVLFVLVCICHWNACIWWMIGQPVSLFTELLADSSQAWWKAEPHWTTIVRSYGPGEDQWTWIHRTRGDCYIFCFYWTLGVMRTMPAEVQPVNQPERLYIMFFMFFAFSAFAICVAQITQTFFKFTERKRTFNDDMSQVRMYLRHLKVSEQLQLKVKMFLRHLYDTRRIQAKELAMMGHLPAPIRHELEQARLNFHLDKIERLRYISTKSLNLIADCSEMRDIAPGDILCIKDKVADSVFVLARGRLHAVPNGSFCDEIDFQAADSRSLSPFGGPGGPVKTLEVVDEECLRNFKHKSKNTVLAILASSVLRIDKKSFREVYRKHPHILQKERTSVRSNYSSGGRISLAGSNQLSNASFTSRRMSTASTCSTFVDNERSFNPEQHRVGSTFLTHQLSSGSSHNTKQYVEELAESTAAAVGC